MSTSKQGVEFTVKARVKWYNIQKGHGYVHVIQLSEQAYIQRKALIDFGIDHLEDGAFLEVVVLQNTQGLLVTKILKLESEPRKEVKEVSDWIRAKVKWYRTDLGYGFLETQGLTKDIWVGEEVIYKAGMNRLVENEFVEVRYAETKRSPAAQEIRYPKK